MSLSRGILRCSGAPASWLALALAFSACGGRDSGAGNADARPVATATSTTPPPAPPDVASPPPDATKSPSGLATKVLSPGTGAVHPGVNDSVKVTFAGWTTDGAPFMNGDGVTFHLARAILGFGEALQQMLPGEKLRAWIPPKLAYAGQRDAPPGMLVFDIQLLEIIPGPKAPADVMAPPADAMRLQDGLASKVIAPGRGKVHPGINDIVTLTFASWTTDGAPFTRAEAVPITVGATIPGWREALPLMVVGEKRRVWLPPALAYEGQSNAPTGLVVFDIELIDITVGPKPPPYVWAPSEDAKTSKDGLASKVVTPGRGHVHPRPSDGVLVHFTAWDREGRLKDASGETPVVRPMSMDFRGWTEGLAQMVVGETRILWVPASLAPELNPQAPASDMTFLVELVEILPAPKAPSDVRAPPRKAIFARDGLASKILVKGAGTNHPDRSTTVTIDYAGWTTDGKLLGTSYTTGKPVTVSVGGSIPGWTEALELMVEGEKRRVWIPKQLGFKDHEDGPKGMLVFDIELRKIIHDEQL